MTVGMEADAMLLKRLNLTLHEVSTRKANGWLQIFLYLLGGLILLGLVGQYLGISVNTD